MTAPTPSAISIPPVTVTPQALVDQVQVTTTAGLVDRQVIAIGDPATAANYAAVDAGGALLTGTAITPTEAIVAVSGNSVVAIAANTAAKYRFIQNLTANPIRLNLSGGAAAANAGIYIGPFGTLELSRAKNNLITGIIHAISMGVDSSIYVLEGT